MFRIAFILSISTFSIHILIQCIIVGNHSIHSKYHQRHEAFLLMSFPTVLSMSFSVERLILTEYIQLGKLFDGSRSVGIWWIWMVGKEMFKHSNCEHESIKKDDRTFSMRELLRGSYGNVDAEKCIWELRWANDSFFLG